MTPFERIIAGIFVYQLLIVIAALIAGVFWCWMLVDCILKESNENNERIVWLLVIILTNFFGAILYFFMRWARRQKPVDSTLTDGQNQKSNERATAERFLSAYNKLASCAYHLKSVGDGLPFEVVLEDATQTLLCAKFYRIKEPEQIRERLEDRSVMSVRKKSALVLFYNGELPNNFNAVAEIEPIFLNRREMLKNSFGAGIWLLTQSDGRILRLL